MFLKYSQYEIELKSFYKTHYLNKNGEGAGGKFNGPSIKTILQNRNDLEYTLPEKAVDFVNFVHSR